MPAIISSLWFDGQAEQAAAQYVEIFPASEITEVTRYGPGEHGSEGSVMTVGFHLDGQRFLGINGGPQFTFAEAVSFRIRCADQEEVDHYWSRLGDGGEEGPCGWLKDRFGLSWQVVPTALVELIGDPDRGRAHRATQAMLEMREIDIDALRRAADRAPA